MNFRFVLFTLLTSLVSASPAFAQPTDSIPGALSDEDLAHMDRDRRRENLAERRIDLIDRYNRILNQIALNEGMKAGDRKKASRTAPSAPKLKKARDLLASSTLLGELRNRGTSPGQLEKIADDLNQAQSDIEWAEKLWLKGHELTQAQADAKLEGACRTKVTDSTSPIKTQTETQLRELIAACENEPRQAVGGIIITRDGRKLLPEENTEPPVKTSYIPARVVVSPPPPSPPAPVKPTETKAKSVPKSKPKPEPKPAKLAPKPAPLNEEAKAKLSILPAVPGMKFVAPPTRAELSDAAHDMLKAYDPAQDSIAQIKPRLDEFLMGTEATGDGSFNSLYEYSYGLARWNHSIERYSEAKPTLEQALKLSHAEYWKNYHRDAAQLTDFMNGRGGNCEAQSKMIFSLIDRLDFKLPHGQRLLAQPFSDHLQPVIYDEQKNEVLNLVSGKRVSGTTVDLYDPMILINAWVKKERPLFARNDADFVRVKANRKADPKMLVQNAGQGGGKTNSNLTLPTANVRAGLGDVPEYATVPEPTMESVATSDSDDEQTGSDSGGSSSAGSSISGKQSGDQSKKRREGKGSRGLGGSSLGDSETSDEDIYKDLKLKTTDNRTVEVKISLGTLGNARAECMTFTKTDPDLCSYIMFENTFAFEKAGHAKNYEELWKFALNLQVKKMIQEPDYQKSKSELLEFMKNPLAAAPPETAYMDVLQLTPKWGDTNPQRKAAVRRVLTEADPELKELFEYFETYSARTQSQPYLFAKRWMELPPTSETDNVDRLSSVRTSAVNSYERNLGSAGPPIGYYAPVLDPLHAVWTEEDLKVRNEKATREKKPKAKSLKTAESPPLMAQEPLPEIEPSKDELDRTTSPWRDPRPRKPKLPPSPPQPVFIPEEPIKAFHPDRVMRSLAAKAWTLTPEQREGIKKLWTPAFSKKVAEKPDAVALQNRWELAMAFPESSRCEIYVDAPRSLAAAALRGKPCVPKEIAAMTLANLKAIDEVAETPLVPRLRPNPGVSPTPEEYGLTIAGTTAAVSRQELIEFIDAQLTGRPVRNDLVAPLQKALALSQNPDAWSEADIRAYRKLQEIGSGN